MQTRITAVVPRVKDEVKGMAEWFGVKLVSAKVCYPDGIEAYRVVLEGTPVKLNEYLENTDGEIEEIENV